MRCNVKIKDDTLICPLCRSVLEEGGKGTKSYPNAGIRTRRLKLFSNILLFTVLCASAVCGYVNYITYQNVAWSLIVDAGLFYAFLIFRLAIVGNSGYRMKMMTLTFLTVLYVILIDDIVGYRGWSVNYVLPGAIIMVDAAVIILMIVNNRNWQSYLLIQLFMILCSIVPLILAWLDIVTKPECSVLAFGLSVFLFLGTLIIGDRRARIELKRRFHVR